MKYCDVNDDLEGVAHMRSVMEDLIACPLCSQFEHWNRQFLVEYLLKHDEIKEFLEGVDEEERRYDALQERLEKIKV